jgi:hypothetical protein
VYGELRVRRDIHRTMPYLRAGGIGAEEIVPFPVFGRTHGPRRKATTAVRAHIPQNPFRTVRAEGALVTTYTRLKRSRRQGLVTVLTARSEFEHGASPD